MSKWVKDLDIYGLNGLLRIFWVAVLTSGCRIKLSPIKNDRTSNSAIDRRSSVLKSPLSLTINLSLGKSLDNLFVVSSEVSKINLIKEGSVMLIEEFPSSEDFIDTKEKIEKF